MSLAPSRNTLRLEAGTTYYGLCDGSGTAFLDATTFVAASDETQTPDGENRLQIYRLGQPKPIGHLNLNTFLQLDGNDDSEADIESAARVGNVVYWLTSHGRDSGKKKGPKNHPNRQRLFATRIVGQSLQPHGVAYKDLLEDLTQNNDELKAAHKAKLAPEEGGISIEGLCQGTGNTLWVGFRSPLAYSRALCCEISNPTEILNGKPAKLGAFWTLNLGQRGIRDWVKWKSGWLILAGSAQDADDFALYSWNGNKDTAPQLSGDLTAALKAMGYEKMHPEAITVSPQGDIYLLADDGGLKFSGEKNKNLPEAKRSFRSVRVILPTQNLPIP